MGVSFKLARNGTRYRPKINQIDEKDEVLGLDDQIHDSNKLLSVNQGDVASSSNQNLDNSNSIAQSGSNIDYQDLEVSFILNVFLDGYFFGKPDELLLQAVPKMLLPYDRSSKTLFSAIEYGLLPGDTFTDIPCKFKNGTLLCEVRDYRKCVPEFGNSNCSVEKAPVVHKLFLHSCTESIVNDISSISDDSWTYNDLLEVESRILKTLQPDLNLDPVPLLDRLCGPPFAKKLNLGLFEGRKKRTQNETPVTNLLFDNSNSGHGNSNPEMGDRRLLCMQQATSVVLPEKQQDTMQDYPPGVRNSLSFLTATVAPSSSNPTSNHQANNYSTVMDSDAYSLGKRVIVESQSTHKPNAKRQKQKQIEQVQIELQRSQIDSVLGPSIQQVNDGNEKICPSFGGRDLSYMSESIVESGPRIQAMRSSNMSQSRVQYPVKHEPANCDNLLEQEKRNFKNAMQLSKLLEEDLKKEDSGKRRKSAQFHQPSSPVPSYSEHTSFSKGIPPFTTSFPSASGLKKEHATPMNSTQRSKEKKAPQDGKRKNNSRLQNVYGVQSPASVNNVNVPCSTSNLVPDTTSVPAQKAEIDPILQRFRKIGELSQRYQLNLKKHNFDFNFHRKRLPHYRPQSALQLLKHDGPDDVSDYSSDELFMTKICVWRSHNFHITRVLRFMHQMQTDVNGYTHDREFQKLVVSENSENGTIEVFIFYGDDEVTDKTISNQKYNVRLFSNAESADLYTEQLTSKLEKEGYFLIDDQAKPFPFRTPEESVSSTGEKGSSTGEKRPSFSLRNSGMPSDMLTPVSRRISDQRPLQVVSKNILLGRPRIPSINIQDAAIVSLNQLSRSHVPYSSVPYNTRCLPGNQIADSQYLLQLMMLQNEQKKREFMAGCTRGNVSRMGYGLGYGSRSSNIGNDSSSRISFPSPSEQRLPNIRGMQSGSLVDQFQYPGQNLTGLMNSDLEYGSLDQIRRQKQMKSQQIYQESLMSPYQQLSSGMMDPMSSHLGLQTYGMMMDPNPMNPQYSTQTHVSDAMMRMCQGSMNSQLNSQTYESGGMMMGPNLMGSQLSSQTHGSGGMMTGPNPMNSQFSSQTLGSGGMMMSPNPMTSQLSSQAHGSSGMMAMMGPMSPQLSSQTYGSVNSINGSSMEFQSGNGGE